MQWCWGIDVYGAEQDKAYIDANNQSEITQDFELAAVTYIAESLFNHYLSGSKEVRQSFGKKEAKLKHFLNALAGR